MLRGVTKKDESYAFDFLAANISYTLERKVRVVSLMV